jgi:hypothetical protein
LQLSYYFFVVTAIFYCTHPLSSSRFEALFWSYFFPQIITRIAVLDVVTLVVVVVLVVVEVFGSNFVLFCMNTPWGIELHRHPESLEVRSSPPSNLAENLWKEKKSYFTITFERWNGLEENLHLVTISILFYNWGPYKRSSFSIFNYWTRIGPELDQNWTRIGPELDQNWTRIGPESDQNPTRIRPKSDPNRTQKQMGPIIELK